MTTTFSDNTQFTDNAGHKWDVQINVAAVKRVREMLGVLLTDLEGDTLGQLATDPILLADVLYVVCKPQADAQGVTDEQFGEALAGDAIDQAASALLESLVNFTPAARRGVLRRVLEKVKQVEAAGAQRALAAIDSPRVEQAIEDQFRAAEARLDSMLTQSIG